MDRALDYESRKTMKIKINNKVLNFSKVNLFQIKKNLINVFKDYKKKNVKRKT